MKVLSVDFDIVMAPDINLYNAVMDTLGANESSLTSINELIKMFPMLNNVRMDYNHYQKLLVYLYHVVDSVDVKDIRVSVNHEDIKNVLNGLSDVEVFHIDHHHDLGYKAPMDQCFCSNWAGYFLNNGTISQLHWIKNDNSEMHEKVENPKITVQNFREIDASKDLPQEVDKLFICLSQEWVPEQFVPLFYTILDLINSKKNCRLEVF